MIMEIVSQRIFVFYKKGKLLATYYNLDFWSFFLSDPVCASSLQHRRQRLSSSSMVIVSVGTTEKGEIPKFL